jgi:SAM-dependent methyltransferase
MPTLEYTPCNICGAIDPSPYKTVRDHIYGYPGEFKLVKCGYCGLIYLNPRPDKASIGSFYPDMDYHAFQPAKGVKGELLNRLHDSEVNSILDRLPPSPRILEIGCATGEMLAALKAKGAQVVGIEPNSAAAKTAADRYGLTVHTGILDDVALEPAQFDLVIMKYALEHVHDPTTTVRTIRKLLKPDGRAVFWVPNARSWDATLFGKYWRGYDSPRHLYIFTPDSMQRLLSKAGLKPTAISYSPVPNDWAGSLEFVLKEKRIPFARWSGIKNPLMLVGWLPMSTLAALARRAGRIRVTAKIT